MFYVTSYPFAVCLCVVCMLCWGSWGNAQKLVGKSWRYELFYWDFVLGLLLMAAMMGLTLGSWGENTAWGFLVNLRESFGWIWMWPLLSGIVFNASNILFSASIAVAGMAVAFPIGSGIAGVGGTVLNYVLMPSGKSFGLIAAGLSLVVISIICSAMAFGIRERASGLVRKRDCVKKGLLLAVVAGLLMMWFSPLVNKVIDNSFAATMPRDGKMTAYAAFFVFAIGMFLSNFLWNTIAMKRPVSGDAVSVREYFRGGSHLHLAGMLGGGTWGLGTLLSFVSAGAASPAIAYALGQGATLVSACWGIVVWKEFRRAPCGAHGLNCAMFVLFIAGLAILVAAGA